MKQNSQIKFWRKRKTYHKVTVHSVFSHCIKCFSNGVLLQTAKSHWRRQHSITRVNIF